MRMSVGKSLQEQSENALPLTAQVELVSMQMVIHDSQDDDHGC